MKPNETMWLELNLQDLKLLHRFCHTAEIEGDEPATKWKEKFAKMISDYQE